MTSLAFVFVEVPEPVWKTSIGNWSSCSPAAISAAALLDPARAALAEQAELAVDRGRGALDAARASARPATGTVSPEIGKFSTALAVSPPHSSDVWHLLA